jgi:RND superfamily putative drug exporter
VKDPTPASSGGLGALGRLGYHCARRRFAVIVGWILAAFIVGFSAFFWGGELVNDFEIPGAGSQEAQDLLDETFPQISGNPATLVYQAREGTLESPANQAAVEQSLENAAKVSGVVAVGNPYEQEGALLNETGEVAFSNVQFDVQSFDVSQSEIDDLKNGTLAPLESADVNLNFTGPVITNNTVVNDSLSEALGLIVAVIILLIVLGTVVYAILPIATALMSVGIGLLLVQLEADLVNLNTITPTLATMLGLGVGIDYSLFIVTRHKQALEAGYQPQEAAGIATATAGRAVVFAATTVVVSVLALTVFGLSFISLMGVSAVVAVVISMIAANTLLPGLLGLFGHRVNSLRVPYFGRPKPPGHEQSSAVAKWARFVTRRAIFVAPIVVILLLILAMPALQVQLGASDAGTAPKGDTQRIAYDQIGEAFGVGWNGPLEIVVNQSQDPAVTDELAEAISQTDGVLAVQPPQVNQAGTTASIIAIPTTAPQSEATSDLVSTLREDVIPGVIGDADASAFVGGTTAAFDDIASRITDRLFYFLLIVVGVIFLILMTAFRSVSVGIKAAAVMLLSALASFGVLIAVFQFGWGIELVGLDESGPIESYLPPIVFAILFGLSTDYEVFIMSRIREEYVSGTPARESVVKGVAAVGRVVVAAALIMTAVFLSFTLADDRVIKEFGLALGVSILIDAFLVRLTLVPAIMYLGGEKMWWMPRWLDRLLPTVNVEPPASALADLEDPVDDGPGSAEPTPSS